MLTIDWRLVVKIQNISYNFVYICISNDFYIKITNNKGFYCSHLLKNKLKKRKQKVILNCKSKKHCKICALISKLNF